MTKADILRMILSGLISALISGIFIYYLRAWIDNKFNAAKREKDEKEKTRKKQAVAEMQRRHACGRLLFWLFTTVVKVARASNVDTANLTAAMTEYNTAETEQKNIEQQILAEYTNSSD